MRQDDQIALTRDNILSGRVAAMVRIADPSIHILSDQELATSRAELLNGHDGRDVWVFAYGSLIWNPAFHYVERRPARLYGYHRRFCLRTHLGRGTPDRPGLMLGLEAGGSCTGIAFRIAADAVDEETWVLWKREMILGTYMPRWVVADGAGMESRAVTFVMNKAHPMYAGRLPRSEIVRTLALAQGMLGRGCDYVYHLVAELEAAGIHDRGLATIAREIRALQQADAG